MKGYSDYADDNGLMTYYHERIKILREDGKKYGDVTLSFHSENEFEFIDNIEAISINTDDNGRRQDMSVDKKSIYFKTWMLQINLLRTY